MTGFSFIGWGAVAVAFWGISTLPARAQTSPVLPGYWESTDTVILLGTSHERKCLSATQITAFLAAPSNKHYQCTYASRRLGDGQATFRGGSCYSHAGRKVLSDVGVDGRYAAESFHLNFRFNLMVSAGVGLPGTAEIDAHRISAQCPADQAASH